MGLEPTRGENEYWDFSEQLGLVLVQEVENRK